MPDGDKFYWGVRGAGSRTLLSLARAGAGLELVADQGAKLVTGQLKKPVIRRVLAESLRILEPALPRFETDSSVPLPMADEVHRAFRRLRSGVAGVAQHALAQQLVLPAPVVADRLIVLYRRHCAEWYQFPTSSLAQLHRKAA